MSTPPSDSPPSEAQIILTDNERSAVTNLLQYLENLTTTNFFSGEPLSALTTLSFSDKISLQQSAALAFAEATDQAAPQVGRDTLDPLLFLLSSNDTDVQRGASAALGNLAVNVKNKVLIVKLGGLEPLIRRMQSPNVDVQCNAVGCLTNLASHDENKTEIARSGALIPLVQLAHSEDIRVQRNATGSLLNMTHTNENRQQLVNAGATPVLVNLLTSPDTDIQYYCTTALSNIAVDSSNRSEFLMTEPELVQRLVGLMDNPSLKIQRQAASALRNLASDEKYQIDIVEAGGLIPLLRLINSGDPEFILPAVACIRNLSINSQNESPLIGEGFLDVLSSILSMEENEEIQGHAVSTLRNLAASSQEKQLQVVQSGAIQKMKDLIMHVSPDIQSEMTACIAILARSEELKPRLLEMGICEVLIPLTRSSSTKIQVNSGGAIANLASKDSSIDDKRYTAFNDVWDEPEGGMNAYLYLFLTSPDPTLQSMAVSTMVQLLEYKDPELTRKVRGSSLLLPVIRRIVDPFNGDNEDHNGSEKGDVNTHRGLIVLLAKKILHLVG